MKIRFYYETGSVGILDTTILSKAEGYILDDCYLNAQNIKETGILIERMSFTDGDGNNRVPVGLKNPIMVIKPEELEGIGLITVDGEPFALQIEPGDWKLTGIDALINARTQYAEAHSGGDSSEGDEVIEDADTADVTEEIYEDEVPVEDDIDWMGDDEIL